jgi:UDP-N-acetylglucosamine 1-carboxyvinyltransferase
MTEISYTDGEWPEVVVVFLTWAGPPERNLSQTRVGYARRSIQSVREHLHYPNLSWHIADDGSPKEHQDEIKALFAGVDYTFTDTGKGWDVNNNWNRAAKVAFDRADIMVLWPDDRFVRFDVDLRPFVRLLMSYDDVCDIRLKPKLPGHVVAPMERVGQKWWRVDRKATTSREVIAYFGMRHRRYIDHYGYLPTGIWPVKLAASAMNRIFRDIPGPSTVVPDVIQAHIEAGWGPKSTSSGEPKTTPPWKEKTDKIVVVGPMPLRGAVKVSGAKNVVLPALAASLLARGKTHLTHTPHLTDVAIQARLLRSLGANVAERDDSIIVDAKNDLDFVVPFDLGSQIRYSLLMLSVLLSRCGEANIPLPGGCSIGDRKFDMHLDGLRAMGAGIDVSGDTIRAESPHGLKGAEITFRYPTFSGTINIMMAATLADGTTTIKNAAVNPEIVNIAFFLHKMGAKIKGAGTRTLVIEGVDSLGGCKHTIPADRIETLTFLVAGAVTGGDIVVNGCSPGNIANELAALQAAGATIECMKQDGLDSPEQKIHIVGPEKLQAVSIATSAYPGFHTDCQPFFATLMTVANGQSVIEETIVERRFSHLAELAKMGAKVEIRDGDFVCPNGKRGQVAVIDGVDVLHGASVRCRDLRAGMALLVAGLAAEGETIIENANVIDRGYENIDGKLLGLRAYISRQR